MIRTALLTCAVAALSPGAIAQDPAARPRKVVLIAGPITGHPKDAHEYERSVILLKHILDTSPSAKGLRVEAHFKGWPADPRVLDDADTIVLISDGGDHNETEHPLYVGERLGQLEKQAKRGCGFVQLHWTTFHPSRFHDRITEIAGGYFDYETGTGNPKWYSKIETGKWQVSVLAPEHPICRGVRPFEVEEEFYYKLRFRENDARLRPILAIAPASGGTVSERTVAWAIERVDGGRAFGFTGGHYFENWRNSDFRRLVLNAIAWSAHADVPDGGIESGVEEPIKMLIVTGYNHPAHEWRGVTAALLGVLEQDPRVTIGVTEDPEDLASPRVKGYGLIVLNYCNWDRPGLSAAAKEGLLKYLGSGGGLAVIHFANGAFNSTLPAKDSDWDEYRTKIVRRVWMHGEGGSGHDAFAPFRVAITGARHPITQGLGAFDTEDELYFDQKGELPIEPLVTARSKVTGRDEPLAWAYEYSRARVFQTVLGHSDVSVRKAGALIRRGAVWAAGRSPISFDPPPSLTDGLLFRDGSAWSPAKSKEAELKKAELKKGDKRQGAAEPPAGSGASRELRRRVVLVDGRFGKALDARQGGVVLSPRENASAPPITVDCWAKLESKIGFNILVASEPKALPEHWELYTFSGSGVLSVYLPGVQPAEIRSREDVCDGQWHHVALIYEPGRVRLYADGKQVVDQAVKPRGPPLEIRDPRTLAIGCLVGREIGCDGLVDEVRIRRGAQAITGLPRAPSESSEKDADTLGMWHLDDPAEITGATANVDSPAAAPIAPSPVAPRPAGLLPPNPGIDGGVGGHWGVKNDSDWVDGRIAAMDYGAFFSSSLETPSGIVAKAISIRLGERGEAAVCFDTAERSLRCGWTGGFLELSPKRFGLIEMPRIAGAVAFCAPAGPGWGGEQRPYRGLHVNGKRVVLEYEVVGMRVLDSPWIEKAHGITAFTRTIQASPFARPRALHALQVKAGPRGAPDISSSLAIVEEEDGVVTALAIIGCREARIKLRDGSRLDVVLPGHGSSVRLKLLVWSGMRDALARFQALVGSSPEPEDLATLAQPGPPRWGSAIETRGALGSGDGPYVIDTLTVPYENPHHALLYLSGHDFFSNGDAAVSSVHGDVWIVSGIDAGLEKLAWRRFATGLYQPLGLRVVDDDVYVLGRDQITRLRDLNRDGEADFYECFSNDSTTSAAGHDFHTCLETDAEGRFYYLSPAGLHRVSRDGTMHETIASGWRNPNGLAIGPRGTITVAPQEGEWTPASQICEVKAGGYYGYPGPRTIAERPLGHDAPLCWIPRHVDNSTGGQVWVTGGRWGPLEGQLLSLSFGRSSIELVLRDTSCGVAQGAVVPLKGRFLSGAMRGRFRSRDGQLYVTGLMGWVTNAIRDGCFQRVRYTGGKVYLPTGFSVHANGIRLTFAEPLEKASAEDTGNWSARQWNYRYAEAYGSDEYSVAYPGQVGHDPVLIASASLLEDEKSVFVEIPSIRPVMQLHVKASLKSRDGADAPFEIYATVHALGPPLELDAASGARPEAEALDAAEEPGGLALKITDPRTGVSDTRISRLAALRAPEGSCASPFLDPGPFHALFHGHLNLEESGRLELSAAGRGKLKLLVDGKVLLEGEADDLSRLARSAARLRRGRRTITVEYDAPARGDAWFRLYWAGKDFARETIPATALSHAPDAPGLARGLRLREGRRLVAAMRCIKCHMPEGDASRSARAMPELAEDAPSLVDVGSRLRERWMAEWIRDRAGLRPAARMPCLLENDSAGARNIASYLATLGSGSAGASPFTSSTAGGELFAKLGCIACHLLPDDSRADAGDGRLPLRSLGEKWHAPAIREFLLKPSRWHRSTRMPDFKLTASEADSLTAFLLSASSDTPSDTPSGAHSGAGAPPARAPAPSADPPSGQRLVQTLGCLNCHELPLENRFRAPSLEAIARVDWSRSGCVAVKSQAGHTPRFRLGDDERQAIRDFAAAGLAPLFRENIAEAANRLVETLRCNACHERDGREPFWAKVAAETDAIQSKTPSPITVQSRPALTFTGEELETPWLRRFIAGELGYTLRPWLDARMPAFPAHAGLLAEGLALDHGCALEPESEPESTGAESQAPADLAMTGKELLGVAQGFSCVSCHAVGREPARMQLHFGAINLRHARERLRHEYYLRWMLNPQRIYPLSLMPAYTEENGRSALTQVLAGDGPSQFEAIWRHLETLRE